MLKEWESVTVASARAEAAEYDSYRIDPNLFAPAGVVVNNVRSGHAFRAGQIMSDVLEKSLGYEK